MPSRWPGLDSSQFLIYKSEIMFLKPQDILVAVKLASPSAAGPLLQLDLAASIGVSPAEITKGLQRLAYAGLFVPGDRRAKRMGNLGRVRRAGLCEFLVHGLRYALPAHLGEITIGIPTAWGAPPLSDEIVPGGDGIPVWPTADGSKRGMAVKPLYESVPQAASRDQDLYALLALIDALRVGRARDRALAATKLRQLLGVSA